MEKASEEGFSEAAAAFSDLFAIRSKRLGFVFNRASHCLLGVARGLRLRDPLLGNAGGDANADSEFSAE